MAFVGVLSTQLLWEQLVRTPPASAEVPEREVGTRVLA
jgi:hypothetical protein